MASCGENRPLIWPEPPRIGSRITGALMTFPSSTMAKGRPTLLRVTSPKRLAPTESKRKETTGCPVRESKVGWASTSRSPETRTRLRTTYWIGCPAESISDSSSRSSEPGDRRPARASATEALASTMRNTIFAVRPSRRFDAVGVVDARELHQDSVRAPGAESLARAHRFRRCARRTISIDWVTAESIQTLIASSVTLSAMAPSDCVSISISRPPTPNTPLLTGAAKARSRSRARSMSPGSRSRNVTARPLVPRPVYIRYAHP